VYEGPEPLRDDSRRGERASEREEERQQRARQPPVGRDLRRGAEGADAYRASTTSSRGARTCTSRRRPNGACAGHRSWRIRRPTSRTNRTVRRSACATGSTSTGCGADGRHARHRSDDDASASVIHAAANLQAATTSSARVTAPRHCSRCSTPSPRRCPERTRRCCTSPSSRWCTPRVRNCGARVRSQAVHAQAVSTLAGALVVDRIEEARYARFANSAHVPATSTPASTTCTPAVALRRPRSLLRHGPRSRAGAHAYTAGAPADALVAHCTDASRYCRARDVRVCARHRGARVRSRAVDALAEAMHTRQRGLHAAGARGEHLALPIGDDDLVMDARTGHGSAAARLRTSLDADVRLGRAPRSRAPTATIDAGAHAPSTAVALAVLDAVVHATDAHGAVAGTRLSRSRRRRT
jgi:hypothetical protein